MKTNDILLKFQSNNTKLETILSKKEFSGDVKNLLLSMLYKLSSSYNDYSNIKVNVENKNKFVEDIIGIINKCESIEIIKPNTEEGEEYTELGITSRVDTYLKTIRVFPTEKAMLLALYKMDETRIYLDEKHHIIRIALPELLNEGRDINNIEIIRDFNAWSWNTLPSEISNIDCNLIYQNLLILLGYDFLENWMKKENEKNLLEQFENKLKSEYDDADIEKLLDLIYRVAIIVCVQRNNAEKVRLTEEKEWDEKELDRLNDKENLVVELTKTKKEKAKEIKKLDKIINNKDLLEKEFEKRNSKLSEYKKIFSISNLLGTIKKERRKALSDIDECNKLLDAKNYVKTKTQLEDNLKYLKEVKNIRHKEKYKIEIQKIFIKLLEEKLDKIERPEQRKELVQFLYMIRYYNFIVFDENNFIKDIEPLQDDIEYITEKAIRKLYNFKILNTITKDIETDLRIIKPILHTRIMKLENITIQTILKDKIIEINVYDGDVLETSYEIENSREVDLRNKKKTKLFS